MQGIVQLFPSAVQLPTSKTRLDRAPSRKLARQITPLTACSQHIQNRVHHCPPWHTSRTTKTLLHKRLHSLPRLSRQIARIMFDHTQSLNKYSLCKHSLWPVHRNHLAEIIFGATFTNKHSSAFLEYSGVAFKTAKSRVLKRTIANALRAAQRRYRVFRMQRIVRARCESWEVRLNPAGKIAKSEKYPMDTRRWKAWPAPNNAKRRWPIRACRQSSTEYSATGSNRESPKRW